MTGARIGESARRAEHLPSLGLLLSWFCCHLSCCWAGNCANGSSRNAEAARLNEQTVGGAVHDGRGTCVQGVIADISTICTCARRQLRHPIAALISRNHDSNKTGHFPNELCAMWASALLRGPPCCAAARPQRVDHVATARPLSGPSLRPVRLHHMLQVFPGPFTDARLLENSASRSHCMANFRQLLHRRRPLPLGGPGAGPLSSSSRCSWLRQKQRRQLQRQRLQWLSQQPMLRRRRRWRTSVSPADRHTRCSRVRLRATARVCWSFSRCEPSANALVVSHERC